MTTTIDPMDLPFVEFGDGETSARYLPYCEPARVALLSTEMISAAAAIPQAQRAFYFTTIAGYKEPGQAAAEPQAPAAEAAGEKESPTGPRRWTAAARQEMTRRARSIMAANPGIAFDALMAHPDWQLIAAEMRTTGGTVYERLLASDGLAQLLPTREPAAPSPFRAEIQEKIADRQAAEEAWAADGESELPAGPVPDPALASVQAAMGLEPTGIDENRAATTPAEVPEADDAPTFRLAVFGETTDCRRFPLDGEIPDGWAEVEVEEGDEAYPFYDPAEIIGEAQAVGVPHPEAQQASPPAAAEPAPVPHPAAPKEDPMAQLTERTMAHVVDGPRCTVVIDQGAKGGVAFEVKAANYPSFEAAIAAAKDAHAQLQTIFGSPAPALSSKGEA